MTVLNLITAFQSLGYHLYLDGEQVRYKCLSKTEPPADRVRPLLAELKAHKQEVLTYLICYACGGAKMWIGIHDNWVCYICHPPAVMGLVKEIIAHA